MTPRQTARSLHYSISVVFTVTLFCASPTSAQTGKRPPAPTHLCSFGKIFVPCIELQKPLSLEGFQDIRYRPTKWIPIWPSNAIFGAEDDEKSKFERDYYNRATPFDASQINIETAHFASGIFDKRFVDTSLSYMSSWMTHRERYAITLTETNNVFRGSEILDLWKQSAQAGIVCEGHTVEYYVGPSIERHCAFTRTIKIQSKTSIEYCTYEVDVESDIRGAMNCTQVAEVSGDSGKILATRYVYYDFSGGDYAGQFRCKLAANTIDQASNTLREFLRQHLGISSKFYFLSNKDDHRFRAEGINIEDKEEKMFVRTALSGSLSQISPGKRHPRQIDVFLDAWFSVSAQSTDDITNYREPNAAMGNRLRNHFERALKKAITNGSICWFDG